jgi:hypothetical protein
MGIVRKLKDAARWVENVSEHEAPRAPEPEPAPAPKPKKTPGDAKFARRLGERIGFAGVVAFTVGAALLGSVSACKVPGQPEPRAPYTEDADKRDYTCGYDGNQLCPSTPPPVRASCDEPASWCHRGDAAEAVQR